MPSWTTDRPVWATSAVRAGYAAALLLAPERLLNLGAQPPIPQAAIVVARVLGARHLLQSVVSVSALAGWVMGAGAAVDALHACTQAGLAAMSPRWRSVALADAALAALLAASAGGAARARSHRRLPETLQDRR